MTKEVIKRLREYYKLGDDMSDEEVIKYCKGSLGEATINLNIAVERLTKAFRDCMPKLKFLNNEIKKIQPVNSLDPSPDTVFDGSEA